MSVEFGAETAKTAGVTVRDSPGRSFNFVASTIQYAGSVCLAGVGKMERLFSRAVYLPWTSHDRRSSVGIAD